MISGVRKQLKCIRAEWSRCTACDLHKNRKRSVSYRIIGDPDVGAPLLIGEAPGAAENESGQAFVGASGQLLDELLAEAGIEHCVITNVVACKPPLNRDPKLWEMAKCGQRLYRFFHALKPDAVITIGKVASDRVIVDLAGHKYWKRGGGYPALIAGVGTWVVPTWHPAYLLRSRSPGKRRDVIAHLKDAVAERWLMP